MYSPHASTASLKSVENNKNTQEALMYSPHASIPSFKNNLHDTQHITTVYHDKMKGTDMESISHKKRNELMLPHITYAVADDWIDKLGVVAFAAWIKLQTFVDRRDKNREHDRVPYTLTSLCKHLGVSKSKLYRNVIPTLWNYSLIDLVEYEKTERKTNKPVNVIVYTAPFNNAELKTQPLEKLRDYSTDYNSKSQIAARKESCPKVVSPMLPKIVGSMLPKSCPKVVSPMLPKMGGSMLPKMGGSNKEIYKLNNKKINNKQQAFSKKDTSFKTTKEKEVVEMSNHKINEQKRKEEAIRLKSLAEEAYYFGNTAKSLSINTWEQIITIATAKGKTGAQVLEDVAAKYLPNPDNNYTAQKISSLAGLLMYSARNQWDQNTPIAGAAPASYTPRRDIVSSTHLDGPMERERKRDIESSMPIAAAEPVSYISGRAIKSRERIDAPYERKMRRDRESGRDIESNGHQTTPEELLVIQARIKQKLAKLRAMPSKITEEKTPRRNLNNPLERELIRDIESSLV